MNEELRATLEAVRSGTLSVDEAALRLKKAPFEDLGYAKVDLHRAVRQGAAEVIYGAGKTPAQIAGIAASMQSRGVSPILITRLSPEAAEARASSTAVKMALEVTEAPETPSTPSVPLAATISAGSCSMALEPMPWVSELSPTSTAVMTPPSMVTVTGTLPPMPLPVPS